MKIGIISDVHSNLEALTEVLTVLDRLAVDQVVCLGDLVGYGANPNECIEMIRDRCALVLAGNHDYAVAGLEDVTLFNLYASRAIEWTQRVITIENRQYLSELRLFSTQHNFFFVHATPEAPSRWDYILDLEDSFASFSFFREQACFGGHTHVPLVISKKADDYRIVTENLVYLRMDHQYLINVGSVGQPRDRNPNASFGVLNVDENAFYLHRTAYAVHETQRKMRQVNLPEFLIERLKIGY